MPRLASFYNNSSRRDELIIVIQAINVSNDSIVGFRYLNGGNGSARLNEVRFLTANEIAMKPKARFVTHSIKVNATQDEIWKVLTKPEFVKPLEQFFDTNNNLKLDWWKLSNVNFRYPNAGDLSSSYANKLYGNYYIQNDYKLLDYSEKFLLLENKETKVTELKISCGPYGDDFESQKSVLSNWAQKVKALSENM
jgi:hypothetical protein